MKRGKKVQDTANHTDGRRVFGSSGIMYCRSSYGDKR